MALPVHGLATACYIRAVPKPPLRLKGLMKAVTYLLLSNDEIVPLCDALCGARWQGQELRPNIPLTSWGAGTSSLGCSKWKTNGK